MTDEAIDWPSLLLVLVNVDLSGLLSCKLSLQSRQYTLCCIHITTSSAAIQLSRHTPPLPPSSWGGGGGCCSCCWILRPISANFATTFSIATAPTFMSHGAPCAPSPTSRLLKCQGLVEQTYSVNRQQW